MIGLPKFVLLFVASVALAAVAEAHPPVPTPAAPMPHAMPMPAPPQFSILTGRPQPLYRAPIRAGLWQALQPRAYYVPQRQVQIQPIPACPQCGRH